MAVNEEKNRENVIEFLTGERFCSVTFTNRKHITRIKKLKEEHPEEFKGFFENTDGSVYAKFPLKWVKITPPRAGRTLTEEEKEEVRKRLADARNKKGTKNE